MLKIFIPNFDVTNSSAQAFCVACLRCSKKIIFDLLGASCDIAKKLTTENTYVVGAQTYATFLESVTQQEEYRDVLVLREQLSPRQLTSVVAVNSIVAAGMHSMMFGRSLVLHTIFSDCSRIISDQLFDFNHSRIRHVASWLIGLGLHIGFCMPWSGFSWLLLASVVSGYACGTGAHFLLGQLFTLAEHYFLLHPVGERKRKVILEVIDISTRVSMLLCFNDFEFNKLSLSARGFLYGSAASSLSLLADCKLPPKQQILAKFLLYIFSFGKLTMVDNVGSSGNFMFTTFPAICTYFYGNLLGYVSTVSRRNDEISKSARQLFWYQNVQQIAYLGGNQVGSQLPAIASRCVSRMFQPQGQLVALPRAECRTEVTQQTCDILRAVSEKYYEEEWTRDLTCHASYKSVKEAFHKGMTMHHPDKHSPAERHAHEKVFIYLREQWERIDVLEGQPSNLPKLF